MEIKVKMWLLGANDLREVLPAELVAVLKLAIVIGLLLDRIVRQVDKLIGDVVQAVLATARSNVPVLVAVPLQAAIDAGQEPEASKIELSLVDQQWVIDVLLNYERPVAVFFERASDDGLDLAQRLHYGDALPTVRILTRLDDPSVLRHSVLSFDFIDRLFIVCINLTAIVLIRRGRSQSLLISFIFVLQWDALVNVVLLDRLFDVLLGGPVPLLDLVEVVLELAVLWVVHAMLRVESQR